VVGRVRIITSLWRTGDDRTLPFFLTEWIKSSFTEFSEVRQNTAGYNQSDATRISQPFEASNGDKVSGWAFFQSENYASCEAANDDNNDYRAYDDKGEVVITSASGTTVATPFEQSVRTVPEPAAGGNSGWRYWEHTFKGLTGTEQFGIEARIQHNAWSNFGVSRIGLDDVKTSTGGGPDTTPPETYITSGPCGITPSTSATFEFHSNEGDPLSSASILGRARAYSRGEIAHRQSPTQT
jgi:hypothetical protein